MQALERGQTDWLPLVPAAVAPGPPYGTSRPSKVIFLLPRVKTEGRGNLRGWGYGFGGFGFVPPFPCLKYPQLLNTGGLVELRRHFSRTFQIDQWVSLPLRKGSKAVADVKWELWK